MKVYPLIFSRTKFVDYNPDFMVRPEDMKKEDCKKAVSYVNTAIERVKYTGCIRYAVFPAGNYTVCGIACCTPRLIEKLKDSLDNTEYQEYQTDEYGRPLTFFIGFAVKEVGTNAPEINLLEMYRIYLDYLREQFYKRSNTETKPAKETEIAEISDTDEFFPEFESGDSIKIKILTNYNEEIRPSVINYFFKRIQDGEDISFVSDMIPTDIDDSVPYKYISLSEGSAKECIKQLKRKQEIKKSKQFNEVKRPQEKTVSIAKNVDNVNQKNESTNASNQDEFWDRIRIENQKKTNRSLIAIAIAIATIVLLVKCGNK